MNISSVFNSLKGSWDFHRVVSDGTRVVGRALFKQMEESPHSLLYREEGIMTTPQKQKIDCYKEYVYSLEGGVINVFFKENPLRFFHAIVVHEKKAEAEHLCGLDRYQADYFFRDENNFSLSYQVKGPSKDYQMTTTFSKSEEQKDV